MLLRPQSELIESDLEAALSESGSPIIKSVKAITQRGGQLATQCVKY